MCSRNGPNKPENISIFNVALLDWVPIQQIKSLYIQCGTVRLSPNKAEKSLYLMLALLDWELMLTSSVQVIPAGYDCHKQRIYIRGEFTRKMFKTAILLFCFHTAGVLHIFMLFNLLGPGTSFYRKSKINIKRKQNYEIAWFHYWPMIISHRLYAFHFTNDDFTL